MIQSRCRQTGYIHASFGNRLVQAGSSQPFASGSPNCAPAGNGSYSGTWTAQSSDSNNRLAATSQSPGGVAYDAAGDMLTDGVNQYLYDAEGRVCAVASTPVPGMTTMTGYIYDADGNRVAKGTIQTWGSCDPTVNGFQIGAETDSILGPGGEQVTEVSADASGAMAWQHTNVWAGGSLIATYDPSVTYLSNGTNIPYSVHFYLNDPLGTRRAQTDYAGNLEQVCLSLPFGDGETCAPTPTEHLFTSKERDVESGNDYFGARYFESSMGRFVSPDFGGPMPDMPDTVPWADFENPQTLNLYSYVANDPLTATDPDGHACVVQTRTGDNTENVSVASQGDCSGVTVSDGQSATYVNGTVNLSDISAGADGHSINIGYTSYDGNSVGVKNVSAPYPNQPNLDMNWGNNSKAGVFVGADKVVTYATVGVTATFGSLGASIAVTDALAGSAMTMLGDITATPTAGEMSAAQNTLATGGRKGVERAINTLAKRIAEHQEKLQNISGNPGSIERELAGWRRQIVALQQLLR